MDYTKSYTSSCAVHDRMLTSGMTWLPPWRCFPWQRLFHETLEINNETKQCSGITCFVLLSRRWRGGADGRHLSITFLISVKVQINSPFKGKKELVNKNSFFFISISLFTRLFSSSYCPFSFHFDQKFSCPPFVSRASEICPDGRELITFCQPSSFLLLLRSLSLSLFVAILPECYPP